MSEHVNFPTHWMFTDPINHRYDNDCEYTISRWLRPSYPIRKDRWRKYRLKTIMKIRYVKIRLTKAIKLEILMHRNAMDLMKRGEILCQTLLSLLNVIIRDYGTDNALSNLSPLDV